MTRVIVRGLVIFIGVIMVVIFSFWIYDWYHQPGKIASILNIGSPPDSIHSIKCKSYFTSDVITECTFRIDPNEFDILLEGYDFQKKERFTNSISLTHMIKENFEVAYEFFASPKEFENGGHIKVYSNAQHSRAIIHLYIE